MAPKKKISSTKQSPQAATISSSPSLKTTAALVTIFLFITALSLAALGVVTLPLPAPAQGKHAGKVPSGVYDWQPKPLKGEWALNERLLKAERLFEGHIHGSESVAVGLEGELVMLDRTNAVYEATPDGAGGYKLQPQPIAQLGAGRPLGFHFDPEGHLVVADSLKGLLRYSYYDSQSKDITLLTTHVSASSPIDPGSQITYANDLAIASDGTIYFTSSTDIVPQLNQHGYYDTYRAWLLSMMQGQPQGRLLRYDPNTKETHVLAKGFYYANGVALSADESFAVLAETDRIRVHKVWLKGPKAGQTEVLIDNLPGLPDGVDAAADGGFWISLVAPAPPFKSLLLSKLLSNPLVRALYARLKPDLKAWGAVVKVDGSDGRVLDFLTDPTGRHVSAVSAVTEHVTHDSDSGSRRRLFLGNLVGNYVSYVDLGPADAAAAAVAAAAADDEAGEASNDGGEQGRQEL